MTRSPSLLDIVRIELGGLVGRFYLVALVMIALVVAIPIFVISGLIFGIGMAIDADGPIGAALGYASIAFFLGGTTIAVARIVRWLRPVTRNVDALGDPARLVVGVRRSVQNLAPSDSTRAPRSADTAGDPLITAEVQRWQEAQRR